MKCPYCGKEHPDDFNLCPYTGKKLNKTKQCPNCGKDELLSDFVICPFCGFNFENKEGEFQNSISTSEKADKVLFERQNNCCTNHMFVCENEAGTVTVFDSEFKEHMSKRLSGALYPKRINGKNVLCLENPTCGRYVEISPDSVVENLSYSQTQEYKISRFKQDEDECESISAKYGRILKKYSEIRCIGYSQFHNSHIFVGAFKHNIDRNTPEGAEVITEDGTCLFTVGNYLPISVIEFGFIAEKKWESWDKRKESFLTFSGRPLSSHEFDPIYEINQIGPNLYLVNDSLVLDSESGYMYDDLVNNYLIKYFYSDCYGIDASLGEDDDEYEYGYYSVSAYDVHTKEKAFTFVGVYANDVESLADGWCLVHQALYEGLDNLNRYILFRNNAEIELDEDELVLSDVFTNANSNPNCPKFYCGDSRILTVINSSNYLDLESCSTVRIRDYSGAIIKEFEPMICIKRPYKYGKAVAVDLLTNEVVYLDKKGNTHTIKNSEVEGDILSEVDCFFISDNKVAINDLTEEDGCTYRIMDINGVIIKKGLGWVEELTEGYVKFYDGKYGVMDMNCNVVIEAKYKDITVIE